MTATGRFWRLADRLWGALVANDRRVLLAVGGCSFLSAVAVAVLPAALLPAAVLELAAALAGYRTAVLLAGAAAGGYAALALRPAGEGPSPDRGRSRGADGAGGADGTADRHPEFAYYDERRIVGDDVDELLSPEYEADSRVRDSRRRELRERLAEAAADALVDATGCSMETARRRVANGSWTDRRRAAALVGERAPPPPLRTRVRDWASGEAYRRAVNETLDAVDALAERERDGVAGVDAPRSGPPDVDPLRSGSDPAVAGLDPIDDRDDGRPSKPDADRSTATDGGGSR